MSNGQSSPGWVKGFIPTAGQWNAAFAGKVDANVPIASASSPLTIAASGDYAYTGSGGATWTLPQLSSGIMPIDITNTGTGNLTVQSALVGMSRENINFGGVVVTSIVIVPGASFSLRNYASQSQWVVE